MVEVFAIQLFGTRQTTTEAPEARTLCLASIFVDLAAPPGVRYKVSVLS